MNSLIRPVTPRSSEEPHRAATPLELFFDLVSVIAIAAAAAGLHHAIAENHAAEGVAVFLMAFFAIWWAWMNFTWYASAYANEDVPYHLLTMLIMAGSLVMAGGIHAFADASGFAMGVIGYVIMRIGMIAHWLRAARHDAERRSTALTYAAGIALAQVFWVGFLLLQPVAPVAMYALFTVGVVIELAVPVLAERKRATPWHRHHIVERYGLLNIIVLGETILAGAIALRQITDGADNAAFAHIAIAGLVIVFSMWFLYFAREPHLTSSDLPRALLWGYGHFVIYAAGAGVGAGVGARLAVLIDIVGGHAEVPLIVGDYAVAIPVAFYLLGLWFVRDRFLFSGVTTAVLPAFAVLVLLGAGTPVGLEAIAALTAASVVVRGRLARR